MTFRATTPSPRFADQGVVMLEFLLAFVPLFTLFMGVIQLALLASARIIVQHAAITGGRVAEVVLDDDPRFYAGAERMTLGSWDQPDSRWHAIRRAALIPLSVIAPDRAAQAELERATTAATSVGTWLRALGRDVEAEPFATAITLVAAPGATERVTDGTQLDGRVTLRVTQLALCPIPIAGALMCERLGWDTEKQRARSSDAAVRQALVELYADHAEGVLRNIVRSGVPVLPITAEASFPLQRALYRYASERNDEDSSP